MIVEEVVADGQSPAGLDQTVRAVIAAAPADAVLTIRLLGAPTPAQLCVFSSAHVRTLAPATMNVEVQLPRAGPWVGKPARGELATAPEAPALELPF